MWRHQVEQYLLTEYSESQVLNLRIYANKKASAHKFTTTTCCDKCHLLNQPTRGSRIN